MLAVGNREHGLQPAQHAVGAPVLGQLYRRAQELALMLFQLGFEALEQRERIRRATGKSGQNLVVVQPAYLACGGLDNDIAEGDLAIAAERYLIAAAPVRVRPARFTSTTATTNWQNWKRWSASCNRSAGRIEPCR